jgi:hypothetical protein
MNIKKTDYVLLIIFSFLSGISAVFIDSFPDLRFLPYYTPGLFYGIGIFFLFVNKKRGIPKYELKGIALILFSVVGYIVAERISSVGSVFFPFLAPLIGCYAGSGILASGIGKFWVLDKKTIRRLTNRGGILGFILCIPTSLFFLKLGLTGWDNTQIFYSIVPVVIWQIMMSVEIIKTIARNENSVKESVGAQPLPVPPNKVS